MIKLQIPTSEMLSETKCLPFLDAYEVSDMEDYDDGCEIGSTAGWEEKITYENAEQKMLEFAMAVTQ